VQGYPFRGKADVLDKYRVVDLKTTSDLKAFPLFNKPYEEFKFAAIDKGSLDIGIYDVSEEFYNSGKEKVTRALETDSYCIKGTL